MLRRLFLNTILLTVALSLTGCMSYSNEPTSTANFSGPSLSSVSNKNMGSYGNVDNEIENLILQQQELYAQMRVIEEDISAINRRSANRIEDLDRSHRAAIQRARAAEDAYYRTPENERTYALRKAMDDAYNEYRVARDAYDEAVIELRQKVSVLNVRHEALWAKVMRLSKQIAQLKEQKKSSTNEARAENPGSEVNSQHERYSFSSQYQSTSSATPKPAQESELVPDLTSLAP